MSSHNEPNVCSDCSMSSLSKCDVSKLQNRKIFMSNPASPHIWITQEHFVRASYQMAQMEYNYLRIHPPLLRRNLIKQITLLKVILPFFIIIIFLATPHVMWDLSSPIRELNLRPLHWKGGVLIPGPPGKSLPLDFYKHRWWGSLTH